MMYTLVYVDPESSTQVDGAQSSRVPVPLPEDPYKAIRRAYLVGTDTESETPKSPHIIASLVSLPDSTLPVCHVEESEGSNTSSARSTSSDSTIPLLPSHSLTRDTPVFVPSLRRTARMEIRVQPVLSPGYSARIVDAATTEGDELEDEEVGDSSDFDSGSEDAEDEGLTAGDVRAALWHAISDVHGENRNLLLQLAEERRARLELAKVVDGMRRGKEPRGGA
ncbi:hypothetical protein Tco_0556897 [Tanacetum coccineum]